MPPEIEDPQTPSEPSAGPQTPTSGDPPVQQMGEPGGAPVTIDQFNSAIDRLAQQLGSRVQPTAPAPVPEVKLPEAPTPEQIAQAVAEGDGAKIAKLFQQQQVAADARINHTLQQTEQRMLEWGNTQLGAVVEQVGKSSMPHYDRFKTEIDAHINSLDPSMRNNLGVRTQVYELVLGRHANELANEAVQEALRKAAAGDDPTPGVPNTQRTPSKGGDEDPYTTPAAIEASQDLQRFGYNSLDDMAHRLGGATDPTGEGRHWAYMHSDEFLNPLKEQPNGN